MKRHDFKENRENKNRRQIQEAKASFLNFFKAAPCQEIDLQIERSKDLTREIDR